MIGKATLVAHPDLIDFFILPRHHTLDHKIAVAALDLTARVQRDVAAHRALRADRSRGLQLPRARLEAEVARRQGTNRADVGGVARENGIKARVREGHDLHGAPALVEAEHRVARDLILETDAARTLDAAFLVEDDQITERHGFPQMEFFIVEKTALAGTMRQGQVLQRALAAFVADRAVERMRREQEFDRAALPILCLGAV